MKMSPSYSFILFIAVLVVPYSAVAMQYVCSEPESAQQLEPIYREFLLSPENPTLSEVDLNKVYADGNTLLITAVFQKKGTDFLDFLVTRGAQIDQKGADGNTPLMHAAALGDEEQIIFLKSRGANIHLQNKNGQSALSIARLMQRSLQEQLEKSTRLNRSAFTMRPTLVRSGCSAED